MKQGDLVRVFDCNAWYRNGRDCLVCPGNDCFYVRAEVSWVYGDGTADVIVLDPHSMLPTLSRRHFVSSLRREE